MRPVTLLRPLLDRLEARQLLAAVEFVVDPLRSALELSQAVVDVAGPGNLSPQKPGSMRATYGGVIRADVTTSAIRFTGGSNVDAIEQAGPFLPVNGSADYAGSALSGGRSTPSNTSAR
jgi:hypothetical protein